MVCVFFSLSYEFCLTMEKSPLGNLYFLNVKDEDEQKQFICNVFSRKLNVIRRGALTQLKVIKSDPVDRRPTKLWASEMNKVVLKGQTLALKCIFAGVPTPDVVWRKISGTIPEKRSTINLEKQELTITDVQYEDGGIYECRGHNGKPLICQSNRFSSIICRIGL